MRNPLEIEINPIQVDFTEEQTFFIPMIDLAWLLHEIEVKWLIQLILFYLNLFVVMLKRGLQFTEKLLKVKKTQQTFC
jgi:hypothetical protein